jgi:hypothetical protein
LVSRHQHPAGGDTDDSGQSDPFPDVAHAASVPKLRW